MTDDEHPPTLHAHRGPVPISYGRSTAAAPHFWNEVHGLLQEGQTRICDIGGGSKPILSRKVIERHNLAYVVADASEEELEKTPVGYQTFHADVLDAAGISRLTLEHGPFDVVLSRWTAEHILDGKRFHEQVLSMLRPGGTAVHLMPTLYTLPFVVNRILGARLSQAILFRLYPRRHTKFPAYYAWCRGPSRRQIRRVQATGFSIEHYVGFFGHGFYAGLPPLHRAQQLLTNRLLAHPVSALTSFAVLVLKRPTQ